MVCECQSTTDPVIQSIWESLQNYDYKNARFIAERVFAENPNEETLYLLATCLYRNNLPKQAKILLLRHENNSPKCKYLLAKCHMDTGNINEAECVLIGSNQELSTVLEVQSFYKDLTPYVLMILGEIFNRTDRRKMSTACFRKCLELNPFLWGAYEELINMSENVEPADLFVLPKEVTITNTSCLKVLNNRLNIGEINHPSCLLKKRNDIRDSQEDLSVSRENVNPKFDEKYFESMDLDDDRMNINTLMNRSAWSTQIVESTDNNTTFPCNLNKSVMSNPDVSVKMPLFGSVHIPSTVSFGNSPGFNAHEIELQEKRTAISSILSQNTANSGKKVRSTSNTNKKFPIPNFRCTDTSTPICVNKQSSTLAVTKDSFSNHPQHHHLATVATGASPTTATTAPHFKATPPQVIATTTTTLIKQQQLPPPSYEFSPIISSGSSSSPTSSTTSSIVMSPSGPRTRSQVAKAAAAHQKMQLMNTTAAITATSMTTSPNKSMMSQQHQKSPHKLLAAGSTTTTNTTATTINMHPPDVSSSSTVHSGVAPSGVTSATNFLTLLQAMGAAYKLLKCNKFSDAISCLHQLPKQHLDTALVSNWLARAHFELTESTKAYEVLFNSRKMEPWQLHGVILYSSVLWKLNKETLLLNLSNEMLEFDRECAEIWCVYGNCMSLHRDSDAAIRFLQRAIQINPKLTIAYILLGHEFYLEDEIDKALLCFRRVQELDRMDHKPLYGISMIYQRQEKYSEACRLMKEALKLYPDSLYLLTNLAVIYTKLYQQYDDASTANMPITIPSKTRSLLPTRYTSNYSMAENCLNQALELIDRACDLYHKEPICIYHKSTILYQMGHFDEALEGLKQLSSVNPKESRVLMLISLIYKQLDNPTLSMMYSSRATELDPKSNNESLLLDRSIPAATPTVTYTCTGGNSIEVARGSAPLNTSASSTSSVVVIERGTTNDGTVSSEEPIVTTGNSNHVSLDFLESD